MESVKESLAAMSQYFQEQMEEFQKELRKTSPTSVSTTSLASEFSAFKKFVVATLSSLHQQIEFMGREVDRLEMSGRRKMLLIHGIPEVGSEDIASAVAATITDKLKVTGISSESFSRCYRLGRSTNVKSRPVAVKFREAPIRDKVWFEKTKLKGTGITLSEFLTKPRHLLFMEARQRFGVKQCWTREGSIYVLAPDGSRHQVSCMADIEAVSKVQPSDSSIPTVVETRKVEKTISRTKKIARK